ncbi:rhamnulose-1-phosphate aldolase [Enterococcus devriesei]|uniref:rhamnulose-1-phosphate aldolase n=1 Tax=Enterococcus devriesei TaxID=319970 RepID=UPI001C0F94C4|nr:rhamnulose-1-phosphate aldolase [Enterococcus devriesei]MBU5365416.1 rhamnulose-1-phosphate aldolase [Enterococcus devriesei]MDT2822511.1 rhamnulose-1-phosphate aldolase [Enterococcus devriesei]
MALHDITQAPFITEICEAASQLWSYGWAERNGGNISYRLPSEEVKQYLDVTHVKRKEALNFTIESLAGEIFLVTGSGKYFKHLHRNPAANLALIRVTEDGQYYELLWGLEGGDLPTSELASHLECHRVRLAQDPQHRVILHTHATAISAMTFIHELEDKKFTKTLWQMITECLVVFPDGVAVLPWMVAGTQQLGKKSAEKMKDTRIVIWAHHGIMGAGQTMDDAFGLVETAEKAAAIYLQICSTRQAIRQSITDQQLWELADAFQVTPREGILAPREVGHE